MRKDDIFNFDEQISDAFDKQVKSFDEQLRKAKIYCVRGQYDKALEIYNAILDEDMENQDAYVGLLRVHSEDFTVYEGPEIERDIHTIETLFPDIEDPEYIEYIKKRKQYFSSGSETQIRAKGLNDIEQLVEDIFNKALVNW